MLLPSRKPFALLLAKAAIAAALVMALPARGGEPSAGEDERLYEDGKLLFKKHQYKEAQGYFQRCLKVNQDHAECHLALASTCARLRETETAAQHYREFLRLAPGHERAPEVRRLLEDYQRAKAGDQAAAPAVPLPPSAPPADTTAAAAEKARAVSTADDAFQEGKQLLKSRKHKEARIFFERCLELDRNQAECHLALGSVYARLRDPERGAQHYRQFLRLAPQHERAVEIQKLLRDYDAQQARK